MEGRRSDRSDRRARVGLEEEAEALVVLLGGTWRLEDERPAWEEVVGNRKPSVVRVVGRDLDAWDSSLLLFLRRATGWCEEQGAEFESAELPEGVDRLLARLHEAQAAGESEERVLSTSDLARAVTRRIGDEARAAAEFIGRVALSLAGAVAHPGSFAGRECLHQMEHAGVRSLPIVSLVSFLVGVIMGFQGSIQLRQVGADIYVVDLIGLAVVREMGPMMAAVVIAGRIGAAYAAELGTMKVGEEIDALETFGISPVDFLVLPRLVALVLMTPLLVLYADAIGILGGMTVTSSVLDISARGFWERLQLALSFSDMAAGLAKSIVFGLLVGMAGCQRGIECGRSAEAIGKATTAAVVISIVLIVAADALFGQIFEMLGV